MFIEVIGPHPFEFDESGRQKTRIGSVFPHHGVLVTTPGIHAMQRMEFVDRLNAARAANGQEPLTAEEEEAELAGAVDLIFESDHILIRPDPQRMELALEADELLEELIAKEDIRFLFVMNQKVREAIRARGECWRISPLPKSADEMQQLLETSKVAIQQQPIYYFNRFTGIRYVTHGEWTGLARLAAPALASQLDEIAIFSGRRNRMGNPEVDFLVASPEGFGRADLEGRAFAAMPEEELRRVHGELGRKFAATAGPDLLVDNPASEPWRNRMVSSLLSQKDQTITEDVLRDLTPEFFMQVEWLPGGRFEEGEFLPDPIYDEFDRNPGDPELQRLCDPFVRSFIFNLVREYGVLDYVNVGRITQSLSRARPLTRGRRGVYIAELKPRGVLEPLMRFVRFQKWGIRERLDEGRSFVEAVLESEEYTDYVLDRRQGVLQFGMNLAPGLNLQRIREVYSGTNREYTGRLIPTIYFDRAYLHGFATDKLTSSKYSRPGYADRLAWLLGRAAATNLIVGRAEEGSGRILFDDGDEVIMENPSTGLPTQLVVADPSGAFSDYTRDLCSDEVAAAYARPVNSRADRVPSAAEFAETYLESLRASFLQLQADYQRKRRGFDQLFKYLPCDPAGSFAYRWECVLKRLDATDADKLVAAIRSKIAAIAGTQAD